jgi:hypothetical protein
MGFLHERQANGSSNGPLQDVVRSHEMRDNFEHVSAIGGDIHIFVFIGLKSSRILDLHTLLHYTVHCDFTHVPVNKELILHLICISIIFKISLGLLKLKFEKRFYDQS